MLSKYLKNKRINSKYTKEPYSNDLKEIIKKYSKEEYIHSPVLMCLLAADRYIHINNITSWMKDEMFVICDRYLLSSWVYQQIQGISLEL